MDTLKRAVQELILIHGRGAVTRACAEVLNCECARCGKAWTPRGAGVPTQCPRCKSIHWQTARPSANENYLITSDHGPDETDKGDY